MVIVFGCKKFQLTGGAAASMRFEFIGGGSIGLLYASRLALAGYPVTVWTRTEEQAEELARHGITLIDLDGRRRQAAVTARWLQVGTCSIHEQELGRAEEESWIWLTVKQPQIDGSLLEQVGQLSIGTNGVLCLQNGIGHMEKLSAYVPSEQLYASVTTEGARRIDSCTVAYTGSGELTYGSYYPQVPGGGRDAHPIRLAELLNQAGITSNLSKEIKDKLYQKLLINAVINPLTALFDVTNGELPKSSTRLRLMHALYLESAGVLAAAGWKDSGESWSRILQVCENTSANTSSMLGDVRAGRLTEIDWINGGVAALGAEVGQETPLNEAAIYMIKSLLPAEEGEQPS
ncbi:ketopantoate reductase family protein [Paenibacillus sp. GCM10023252]|uniref:ketopantoate reductase family protein n=1 Tax=Paenibacillus sp. GCM10023252 TaxID=3252649 RepID=UPI00361A488A